MLRAAATRGCPPEYVAFVKNGFAPGPYEQRLLNGERLVHVADAQLQDTDDMSEIAQTFRARSPFRTLLLIPLRKDARFLGLISALY